MAHTAPKADSPSTLTSSSSTSSLHGQTQTPPLTEKMHGLHGNVPNVHSSSKADLGEYAMGNGNDGDGDGDREHDGSDHRIHASAQFSEGEMQERHAVGDHPDNGGSDDDHDFRVVELKEIGSKEGDEESGNVLHTIGTKRARLPKIYLEFEDIEYFVRVKKGKLPLKLSQRQILKKMSGYFEPGTITAIMGPSGAGKTTLLNILTKQTRAGVRGKVLANGQKVPKSYRAMIGYVRQDDVLMPHLTVYETLVFASLLKMPTWITWADRKQRINRVISELGLENCRNTIVGQPGLTRGVSGGERKRVAIAIELLLEPSVLFLDEPTSGLDATIALSLMETIRRLSSDESGRTVILTIHQPRSSIFHMIDHVMLLTEGQMVYYGPTAQVSHYFDGIGYPMPDHYNPADFMLDSVSRIARDLDKGKEMQEKDNARIETIKEKFETEGMLLQPKLKLPEEAVATNLKRFKSYHSSWLMQAGTVFSRAMLNQLRNTRLMLSRLFQVLAMAVALLIVYGRPGMDASAIQDRVGLLFFLLINQCLSVFFTSLNVFPADITIFLRERSAKTYHVSAFFLGTSTADFVVQLLFPTIFGTITYWACGLNPEFTRFLFFLLALIMSSVVAQAMAHAISTLTKSQVIAGTIGPISIVGYLLFGGFYSNVKNMPVISLPFYWTSLFHFGYEAMALNEFSGVEFVCTDPNGCHETTGEQVIERLGFTTAVSNMWIDLAFLVVLFLILKVLGFLGLRFLQKPKAA